MFQRGRLRAFTFGFAARFLVAWAGRAAFELRAGLGGRATAAAAGAAFLALCAEVRAGAAAFLRAAGFDLGAG